MSLKGAQSLKTCVESPFGIFYIASARSERLDEFSVTLDNPAGVGNTTFGRKELIVRVIFAAHDESFPDRQTNVLDLNQIRPAITGHFESDHLAQRLAAKCSAFLRLARLGVVLLLAAAAGGGLPWRA
jgi:hypothetical protein